ncbi:hypothetical protein BDF20DRAFT_873014 [Mycotypha africana]|uniref:uncharacterized protein n=1 Tax=Mycotypha africana TaxID=64632 RepID=UPI002300CC16|nr:uncharacterized protein BDF20DRAFT_873014 [Mycotypha africana]KAI8977115.1 hypothetical protein BDF20DRAFT_873014 [Mycotypha africana]
MGKFTGKRPAVKTKSAAKKKKEPETFDEFMEEAINSEEQGDRYQTGERAERHYNRAATMYGKAFELNNTDADCVYNWGRILFILVNFLPSHVSPEEKLERVERSIEKFRQALTLEPDKTDAQFNLAQALHQKSEILQDTTEINNAYGASAMALQEAISLFDNVYSLQEKEYLELTTQKVDQEDKEQGEQGEEIKKLKELSIKEEDAHHDPDPPEPEEAPSSTGSSRSTTPAQFTTVTAVEATTAYSLIETLLSTAETMTTMASMLAAFSASMDLFSRAKSKLALAEKWLAKASDETGNDPEKEKQQKTARIQIHLKEAATYAAMADRTFLASGTVEGSLFERAIERLSEVIEQHDARNVEAMCDRGDIYTSYGQTICECIHKKKASLDPDREGKEVWQLYASATKSFQAALQLEPKNLRILNKMGDLSLIRARLDLPIAERNKLQLLKNAAFYFKRAVEIDKEVLTSGYLGWAMSEWALEEWAEIAHKKEDALKIVRVWVKRGGSGHLFRSLAEDNETWDEEFVEFIIENLFTTDSEDSE